MESHVGRNGKMVRRTPVREVLYFAGTCRHLRLIFFFFFRFFFIDSSTLGNVVNGWNGGGGERVILLKGKQLPLLPPHTHPSF